MTDNASELKACPFCGGVASFMDDDVGCLFAPTCEVCGADGALSEDREKAAELWNRRVTG